MTLFDKDKNKGHFWSNLDNVSFTNEQGHVSFLKAFSLLFRELFFFPSVFSLTFLHYNNLGWNKWLFREMFLCDITS